MKNTKLLRDEVRSSVAEVKEKAGYIIQLFNITDN